MDVREYARAKFELAAIMRSAWMGLDADPNVVRVSRDFFARLAEDRFNVVVVGRFNRGKTSLMNAMLATTRLPVGVVPLTSVITTVAYGSTEVAVIEYRKRHFPDRIDLGKLSEYITERGNPGNVRGVTNAHIELPSELLLRGFHFIDTPGLGSSVLENTLTTESFLPEADAVVLVTSFDGALSEEELRVLHRTAPTLRPTFIVVNKSDMVSPEQREEALLHIRTQVSAVCETRMPPVFSVSARTALAARVEGDAGKWQESGVASFEQELTRFLLDEKQSVFLLQMCSRAAVALDAMENVVAERERLAALSARVRKGDGQATTSAAIGGEPTAAGPRFHSCRICRQIESAMYTFLCRYQYDLIAADDARKRLADHWGLCDLHTWQYESVASPRGVCIGYAGLIERHAARLRRIIRSGRERGDVAGPAPQCDLCAAYSESEREITKGIADGLNARSAELRRYPELCLPHLGLLAEMVERDDVLTALLSMEASMLEDAAEDMHRYVLKFDALRRPLLSADEEGAARHALAVLAGKDGLCIPGRHPHDHHVGTHECSGDRGAAS